MRFTHPANKKFVLLSRFASLALRFSCSALASIPCQHLPFALKLQKMMTYGKKEAPKQTPSFSPYTNNGGTVLAVAGSDFCVIAGDTRMSDGGYGISSRNYTKVIQLCVTRLSPARVHARTNALTMRRTDKCVLATSGMQADTLALQRRLHAQLVWYEHQHGRQMSTPAIAQFLGNTLYYKRFFPYYTFNVLGGVDDNGVGCCWSYDAVGSHERVLYSSSGTGQNLVQPFLDNQVGFRHHLQDRVQRSVDETVEFVKDTFTSAGERDIYTGDAVDIFAVTPQGVRRLDRFPLKKD